MDAREVLHMVSEIIEEVKVEMSDRCNPVIHVAAQFAAIRMFERLNKKYDFTTLKAVD